jgi:hypothetical protein
MGGEGHLTRPGVEDARRFAEEENMPNFARAAAAVAAVILFASCAKPAPVPVRLGNAPVAQLGQPAAPPLDEAQRAEVDRVVATMPSRRAHLRYALALDDDGKPRLVVYDDNGLPPSGRNGKVEYLVFKVLNADDNSHYDPQQNGVIAPIPPPSDRDVSITR